MTAVVGKKKLFLCQTVLDLTLDALQPPEFDEGGFVRKPQDLDRLLTRGAVVGVQQEEKS